MFLPGHIHLAPTQRVHFIGIGGIGMSGIAEILLTMGYAVSGSDLRSSPATERLATLGATIYEGHAAANAAACDVVVASSAVSAANPEIVQARLRKVPVIQRAEMLAELMRLKYGIAVAGMHGKTTTTSMIAAVLSGGGLDPTVVVGGRVDALGSNARLGTSQYLVAEADESDRSFLKLSPILAVITNLDREHMDTYSSLEDIENSFVEFMDRLPFYGAATACLDNDLLRAILPRVRRKVYTYGERPDADFRLHLLPPEPGAHSTFQISLNGILIGPFNLHVPGKHNVLNATAAICVGIQLGVTPAAIAKGLATFRGVDRRFQLKGTVAGIAVVDDYGHHPTEILATLRAARDCHYARIHVVFQPHRYTRTRDLLHEFAAAFTDADTVEILDIYAASEEPIPNITGEALAREIATREAGKSIEYSPTVAHAIEELVQAAQPGDVVMTLGAGSVSHIAPLLLEALRVAHPGAETSN
jgi:UDP-N-acetylmuramate--alanine ligase